MADLNSNLDGTSTIYLSEECSGVAVIHSLYRPLGSASATRTRLTQICVHGVRPMGGHCSMIGQPEKVLAMLLLLRCVKIRKRRQTYDRREALCKK